MKSSSFAIATVVLLAANCLCLSSRAFAWQEGTAEAKPCPADQAGCSQPGAGAAVENPAQTQPSSPMPPEKIGFHILAEFSESLNVKKLKPGDKITAEVSQDVLWKGKIIIPVESKLVGHVTEVKRHGADDPESRLGLVFDRVLLKHHQEVDFQGVVQALSPPAARRSKVDEPDQMLPPSAMTLNQNSNGPMGTTPAGRGTSGAATTKSMSIATMPAGVPMYTSGNPGNNPGNSVGGDLKHNGAPQRAETQPMSAGMPRGVFGIKGLSLSAGPSSSTPGPVILSVAGDVKLENGTQVLLKVTDPTVRKQD
jgi:hypothetical protein